MLALHLKKLGCYKSLPRSVGMIFLANPYSFMQALIGKSGYLGYSVFPILIKHYLEKNNQYAFAILNFRE